MTIRKVFALAVLGCVLTAPSLAAQESPDSTRQSVSAPAAGSNTALDRPVSRTGYRLGPGDLLAVSLFGEVSEQYNVPVTPEGTVVVPTIGVTRVLGLNLDQAESRVRDLVGRFYRDIEVRVTLQQIRTFNVFLAGDVRNRGVRTVSAATRVSEILPQLQETGGVRRRNLTLRRADGDSLDVDLIRFQQTGDIAHNPVLEAGDAVVVRVLNQTVRVYGRVAFPDEYEYRPGESLAEFLEVANGSGLFPPDAADTIRINRFTATGSRETVTMTRAEATGARGRALILRPNDAIFVPAVANFRVQRTATVRGQVRFPGTYPIRPDTTTVRDLVALAGGFTPFASLSDATLRREPRRNLGVTREFLTAPDSSLSWDELEVRRITRDSEQGSFVVVDFERLFAGGAEAYNQPLQSGDELSIPHLRNDVTVLGAVVRPGVVAFRHGATYRQYVALAGGYSRRADRNDVSLIRSGQGNRVSARDVYYPRPGDLLVVPYRERRTLLERVQEASAITGAITSLILTYFTIREIL